MPREEAALERSLLTAVAVFRWAALAWTTVVIVLDARNDSFERVGIAVVLLVAAAAYTGWATLAVRIDPHRVVATGALVVEGAIALGLALADGLAYGNLPNSGHSQSLGTIWPLAWVLTVGIRFGAAGGMVAGCSIGSAQFLSTWLFSDITVAMICTSLVKPSANSGRSGRSISRAVKVSLSEGRPSRRKKPPGIRPAA